MLTKNFYEYLGAFFRRTGADVEYRAQLTKFDGEKISHNISMSSALPFSLLGSMVHPKCVPIGSEQYWYGTWFGTGTKPATPDDYTLESPITDGSLSFYNASSVSTVSNEDHFLMSVTYDITNTSQEAIALSEFGGFSINLSKGIWQCLLDHTVLENPIVIPAGQTVPVNYAIKFPYGK